MVEGRVVYPVITSVQLYSGSQFSVCIVLHTVLNKLLFLTRADALMPTPVAVPGCVGNSMFSSKSIL